MNARFKIGDGVFVENAHENRLLFGRIKGVKVQEGESENEFGVTFNYSYILYTIEFPEAFTFNFPTEKGFCAGNIPHYSDIERGEHDRIYASVEEAQTYIEGAIKRDAEMFKGISERLYGKGWANNPTPDKEEKHEDTKSN